MNGAVIVVDGGLSAVDVGTLAFAAAPGGERSDRDSAPRFPPRA